MKNVYFKPFVGKNYKNNIQKIMMLGESHYLWEEDQTPENSYEWGQTLTNDVMSGVLEGTHNSQQTFNNSKAVITGDYKSNNKEFWNNMIFYNYIQGFVGNSALYGVHDKHYLNEEMVEQSKKALFEIMNEYTPNLVIVWGKDWRKMLSWMPENDWNWIDKDLFLWKYDEYPNVLFWNIQHPSTPFCYDEYHQKFQKVKSYL
ncbi:MAG: hypothetical protein KFW21_01760 [Spirochaetota bacterium]|nr:hypothetical protein [Spirochaetota bacterium]